MPIVFDRTASVAIALFAVAVFAIGVIAHEAGHCAAITAITSEVCRPHLIYVDAPQMALSPGEDMIVTGAGLIADFMLIGIVTGAMLFATRSRQRWLSFAAGVLVMSMAYNILAHAFTAPGRPIDAAEWADDFRRIALDVAASQNFTSFRGARDALADTGELAAVALMPFAALWALVEVRMNRGAVLLARAGGAALVTAVCLGLLALLGGSNY